MIKNWSSNGHIWSWSYTHTAPLSSLSFFFFLFFFYQTSSTLTRVYIYVHHEMHLMHGLSQNFHAGTLSYEWAYTHGFYFK